MAEEPAPTPPAEPTPPAPPAAPGGSLLDQMAPHATKIMLGAAVLGVICAFLPLVSFLGTSAAVFRATEGTIGLIGYVGVGVLAGLMLQNPNLPSAKQLSLAALITAGVVALLAIILLIRVIGEAAGIGAYLNVLAALALVAGAVVQAKKVKLF
jgi:peptidoglycan/LPS O-acetylase OafA/YrhL